MGVCTCTCVQCGSVCEWVCARVYVCSVGVYGMGVCTCTCMQCVRVYLWCVHAACVLFVGVCVCERERQKSLCMHGVQMHGIDNV